MNPVYRFLDKIFDPSAKEIREKSDNAGEMLNEHAEEERYRRYKYACYRNIIFKSLLSFLIGLFMAFLVKLM